MSSKQHTINLPSASTSLPLPHVEDCLRPDLFLLLLQLSSDFFYSANTGIYPPKTKFLQTQFKKCQPVFFLNSVPTTFMTSHLFTTPSYQSLTASPNVEHHTATPAIIRAVIPPYDGGSASLRMGNWWQPASMSQTPAWPNRVSPSPYPSGFETAIIQRESNVPDCCPYAPTDLHSASGYSRPVLATEVLRGSAPLTGNIPICRPVMAIEVPATILPITGIHTEASPGRHIVSKAISGVSSPSSNNSLCSSAPATSSSALMSTSICNDWMQKTAGPSSGGNTNESQAGRLPSGPSSILADHRSTDSFVFKPGGTEATTTTTGRVEAIIPVGAGVTTAVSVETLLDAGAAASTCIGSAILENDNHEVGASEGEIPRHESIDRTSNSPVSVKEVLARVKEGRVPKSERARTGYRAIARMCGSAGWYHAHKHLGYNEALKAVKERWQYLSPTKKNELKQYLKGIEEERRQNEERRTVALAKTGSPMLRELMAAFYIELDKKETQDELKKKKPRGSAVQDNYKRLNLYVGDKDNPVKVLFVVEQMCEGLIDMDFDADIMEYNRKIMSAVFAFSPPTYNLSKRRPQEKEKEKEEEEEEEKEEEEEEPAWAIDLKRQIEKRELKDRAGYKMSIPENEQDRIDRGRLDILDMIRTLPPSDTWLLAMSMEKEARYNLMGSKDLTRYLAGMWADLTAGCLFGIAGKFPHIDMRRKAYLLWEVGARHNKNGLCAYHAGVCCLEGIGREPDLQEADSFFKIAGSFGVTKRGHIKMQEGKVLEALKFWERASNEFDPSEKKDNPETFLREQVWNASPRLEAQYSLALWYLSVKRIVSRPKQWSRAYEQTSPLSVTENEAHSHLQKATYGGDKSAQATLLEWYKGPHSEQLHTDALSYWNNELNSKIIGGVATVMIQTLSVNLHYNFESKMEAFGATPVETKHISSSFFSSSSYSSSAYSSSSASTTSFSSSYSYSSSSYSTTSFSSSLSSSYSSFSSASGAVGIASSSVPHSKSSKRDMPPPPPKNQSTKRFKVAQ